MAKWRDLTVENLILAQCIFVSIGNDLPRIETPDFLRSNHAEYWLEKYAKEAENRIKAGGGEYEFIFDVIGSNRCRMYVYSFRDPMTQKKFPGARYSLGITHMNHILGPADEVNTRFERIEQKLLREGFPTMKF